MRARTALVLFVLTVLTVQPAAFAQEASPLTLSVRRQWGYGGGSQIQGRFRMEVTGPADLAQVTFFIDAEVVGTAAAAPFQVEFDTDAYPLGWHTLSATGQTAGGQTLTSNTRRFEFVAAEVGYQAGARIAGVIGAGVAVLFVVLVGVQALLFRGRRGAARYGWLGGAICPRCGQPFPIHLWSLNAVGGRFDRCEHCGKWSLVRRASPEALAAAEAPATPPAAPVTDPEAELRRRLDDTRYREE